MTEGLGKEDFSLADFPGPAQVWELGPGEKDWTLKQELVTVICPEKPFFPLDYLRNLAWCLCIFHYAENFLCRFHQGSFYFPPPPTPLRVAVALILFALLPCAVGSVLGLCKHMRFWVHFRLGDKPILQMK